MENLWSSKPAKLRDWEDVDLTSTGMKDVRNQDTLCCDDHERNVLLVQNQDHLEPLGHVIALPCVFGSW